MVRTRPRNVLMLADSLGAGGAVAWQYSEQHLVAAYERAFAKRR